MIVSMAPLAMARPQKIIRQPYQPDTLAPTMGATAGVSDMRTVAALAGILAVAMGTATATADVPVGPGPNADYTVQPQPAPSTCHYRTAADGSTLPDPLCTPGATNPATWMMA